MEIHTKQCMFCNDRLDVTPECPENLAFMAHLEQQPPCNDAFGAWTTNMQTDYLG